MSETQVNAEIDRHMIQILLGVNKIWSSGPESFNGFFEEFVKSDLCSESSKSFSKIKETLIKFHSDKSACWILDLVNPQIGKMSESDKNDKIKKLLEIACNEDTPFEDEMIELIDTGKFRITFKLCFTNCIFSMKAIQQILKTKW
ncbi:MAG: hypothetical protein K0U52_01285 [Gammaproteobacteria bacterium]|nr:hypothetical protein [Gammaproteobacteria bacterium]